jgi:two-component system, cell cycle response regulator DivK
MAHEQREVSVSNEIVLFADDTLDTRDLYSMYFTSLGYHVLTSTDGQSAIEMALAHRPHVIIVDVSMPKLDGITVTRLLKNDPRTQNIPIIILTAYPKEAIDGGALEAGADVFLMKPCLPEDLEARVRELVKEPNS